MPRLDLTRLDFTRFDFTRMAPPDELGPAQVLLVRDPTAGLEAIVVVDNLALGPAIGGVRLAKDVTAAEVARLARAMTLKSAAAGLPHGGAKAGVVADRTVPRRDKERLVRAFAAAIRTLETYVPGPDMGTDETCMAWLHDEIGRAVGLPRVLGGIPLDEIGATGFGLAACAEALEAAGCIELRGATVAVQGFGAVGRHAARFLAERGAVVVGVADTSGVVIDAAGLDLDRLQAWKSDGKGVADLPGASPTTLAALIRLPCDIWIPAARPDVFTAGNVDEVRARVVIPGANIPATPDAEASLNERGVLVIPDFVANAGGVICAAIEHQGGTETEALTQVRDRVRANTLEVLARAEAEHLTPRVAAEQMARERLKEAMSYRRRF